MKGIRDVTVDVCRASGLGRTGEAGLRDALESGVWRLADRLSRSAEPSGAVQGRCASRVLESALMLQLLRAEDLYPGRQRRISAYLVNAQRRRQVSAIDRVLARAAASEQPGAGTDTNLNELLPGFDHVSAGRKRVMLAACLFLTGATTAPIDVDLDRIRPAAADVHWVRLMVTSLRIIVAHSQANTAAVSRQEQDYLVEKLDRQRAAPVLENHVTAHILAAWAAHLAAPGSSIVRNAIEAMLTCQNPDGGFPGIAHLEQFSTGPAGLALARSGAASPALLRRMSDYLQTAQRPDGGWSFGEGTEQTDVDTSAYAANCLWRVGPDRHALALARAAGYFRSIVNPDGGFPTYVRGGRSETAMTAGAVTALAVIGTHSDVVRRGVLYLLDTQQPDGTFECSWSLSEANAIWRVMWALRAVPADALDEMARARCLQSMRHAHARVSQTQNEDGGWGHRPGDPSDVTSTSYSVLSYTDSGAAGHYREELGRAADYLLDQISPEGGVTAVPDQVAPRPLPFDAPVFTQTWVLMAVSALHGLAL